MPPLNVYIDPQRLISEVKGRPILYNTSLPDNCNKNYKNKAWMEITEVIMDDVWKAMSNKDKLQKCREIQLKWKYLRDNFRREYIMRKSDKEGVVKKKKYRFYNQLLFLVPFMKLVKRFYTTIEPEAVKDERSDSTHSEASENAKEVPDDTQNDDGDPSIEYFVNVDESNVSNNQDALNLEVHKMKGLTEVDEDSAFCVSLIKSLKRMNNSSKLSAKIEILNAIHRLTYPNGNEG